MTLSKDVYQVGWKATEYENDNSEIETLDAHVNDSQANQVSILATHIDATEFGESPRKGEEENSAIALDATEWSSDTGISASETTVSGSVEAV